MIVLQTWAHKLTLQQQTTLLAAIRGPDGFPKHHPSKQILYKYRACVLNSAKEGRPLHPGEVLRSFMSMDFSQASWRSAMDAFREVEDELPLHYYTHLMRGAEVLTYKYGHSYDIRMRWQEFYLSCCDYLHLPPEDKSDMDKRLNDFKEE